MKRSCLRRGAWLSLLGAALLIVTDAHGATVAESLRISEVMYHPGAPSGAEIAAGYTDEDVFEYIELVNQGPGAILLANVSLTNAVRFNFSLGTVGSLDPGEYVVVVKNAAAFALRYGGGIGVAGEYDGKLDNGGEQVVLRDAADAVILDFTYDDKGAWPPAADGDGRSLEIDDLAAAPASWNDPTSWHASSLPGGSPGGPDHAGGVIITELMYHPSTNAYNEQYEFIEIYNRADTPIEVSGWRFDTGVDYTIPTGTTVSAHGYLVVAADTNTFSTRYPTVTEFVGGWVGTLADRGERVSLVDDRGRLMDEVRYADEGSWGTRVRGANYNGYVGWDWYAEHDGYGKSLELATYELDNDHGEYWSASAAPEGTPGASNSVSIALASMAPVITDLDHTPGVPTSAEVVTVTATVILPMADPVQVEVHHRLDGDAVFTSTTMRDDGTGGDLAAGDGTYSAQLPARADGAIVEFYVRAEQAGSVRTFPAATEIDGQVANALYRVFDVLPDTDEVPLYLITMTAAEEATLMSIWANDSQNKKIDAQMNATFTRVHDGTVKKRYAVGVRHRGDSSRGRPPHNARVNFRHDDRWEGRAAITVNADRGFCQLAGSVLGMASGLRPLEGHPVAMRINGTDHSLGEWNKTYGFYLALEPLDGDYLEARFPDDPDGNLFKAASGTYLLKTNEERNDRTALDHMLDVVENTSPAVSNYVDTLSSVIDLTQWLRYVGFIALTGDMEGLMKGSVDDFAAYEGVVDPRFTLHPYDLDTQFNVGNVTIQLNRDIFDQFDSTSLLGPMLGHPEVQRRYYEQLRLLIHEVFNSATADPILDDTLAYLNQPALVSSMKAFVYNRSQAVLQQLATYSPPVLSGTLGHDVILDPASGPWLVTGDVTVDGGHTLTILPGTTLQFDGAYTLTVAGTGRMVAEGTPEKRIQIVSAVPAHDPLAFANAATDNRICHVDFNCQNVASQFIDVVNSRLLMEDAHFSGAGTLRVRSDTSSIIVRDSLFDPPGANEQVTVHGMPADGYVVFSGNTFHGPVTKKDVFDCESVRPPSGPGAQFYNNTFLGGQDDGIDCDDSIARIEGNTFMQFDSGALADDAFAIATDAASDFDIRRNVFYHNEHDIVLKGGSSFRLDHNTLVGATVASIHFTAPGTGAVANGNIFWDMATFSPDATPGIVSINYSLLPSAWHYGTGNLDANPLLADPAGGDFSLLTGSPAAGTGPGGRDMGALVPREEDLRISEIMFHPAPPTAVERAAGFRNDDDFEYVELVNVGTNVLYVAGARFTEGIRFEFYRGAIQTVAPGARILVVKNQAAFEARYGTGYDIAGVYEGSLDNDSDQIVLQAVSGDVIHAFRYDAGWYDATDGLGYALVAATPYGSSSLRERAHWWAGNQLNGTPGAPDTGTHYPSILVNEVLTHTDAPQRDAIELYNPTGDDVALGGWYLTDSKGVATKWRIPDSTMIAANGYHVIYEGHYEGQVLAFSSNEFGSAFSLSSLGDDVHLFSPDLRNSHGFKFGGARNGVSFGRHVNSDAREFFPPQTALTLGGPNAGPRVGPVVISEIMYHPPVGGVEFLELANVSGETVPLHEPTHPSNTWAVSGLGFAFPATDLELAPGEELLLVKDTVTPEAFRASYGLPSSVKVYNFYGSLDNGGEKLQLLCPDEPLASGPNAGQVAYLVVDRVDYDDKTPWPSAADGSGPSLERRTPGTYGNEPLNWWASGYGGTPGGASTNVGPTIHTATVWVTQSSDDAEEHSDGVMEGYDSGDLELVQESDTQTIGVRFTGVPVPPDATIMEAYLQFACDETGPASATSLQVYGEKSVAPLTFQNDRGNISLRPLTTAMVAWDNVPVWPIEHEAGPSERTPDLAAILQELMLQPGWAQGNALALIVKGSGKRVAESYDGAAGHGNPSLAPQLYVEYLVGGSVPVGPVVSWQETGTNGLVLAWQGVPGATYTVSSCSNLVAGAWTAEASGIAAVQPSNTHGLGTPTGLSSFYRVEVE